MLRFLWAARPAGRTMALGFYPLLLRKGAMCMTDFELLSIVFMVISLLLAVSSLNKNK